MDTCICMAECLCCPSETITTLYSHACTPIQNKNQSEKKLSLSSGKGWGKRWEEGIVREFGKVMYTLLYLKWITNKDLLYSTWSSTQVMCQPWWEGVGERMNTCVCMTECLCSLPETTTTVLIDYTTKQSKKFKVTKKKKKKWGFVTSQRKLASLGRDGILFYYFS